MSHTPPLRLRHRLAILGSLLLVVFGVSPVGAEALRSPDGRVAVSFQIADHEGDKACLVYQVTYKGRAVLAPSRLAIEQDGTLLGRDLEIVRQTGSAEDSTWRPVYGERSAVRDHYRQCVVELRETSGRNRSLEVTFRAYNEGIAFCFALPFTKPRPGVAPPAPDVPAPQATINRERIEFRFTADHPCWAVYSAQGLYARVPLSKVKPGCERPLVVELGEAGYAALAEARLVDHARMKFAPLSGAPFGLQSHLDGEVRSALPLRSPWRVVMVADSPGRLLEQNDLLLNLNDPCAIADTSWIKPGKVIREVTLTTRGGKACVDFAASHGLQSVEFDAGWYGHEYSDAADARGVNLDPKRSKGPLDLHEVIRYGHQRGIGTILYVNCRALERQLDEILPLYRRWGVQGVKYGFVNVGSQRWTAWLHEAVRKAAQHQLMVDVHDEYRPTGYSRTYPNLMTQEGIGGDETSPENHQTLAIQFTRMLAGAADNTICYYDPRVTRNASHAYQLAKAVCLYSPWQFLYWYDRPLSSRPESPLGANVIGAEPELEFFARVPTAWDDTRVLDGRIGQYALIARRCGQEWYVGCMNSAEPRTFELPLRFLDKGRAYTAHVYSDDAATATRTGVKIARIAVRADARLPIRIAAQGGLAMRIAPE